MVRMGQTAVGMVLSECFPLPWAWCCTPSRAAQSGECEISKTALLTSVLLMSLGKSNVVGAGPMLRKIIVLDRNRTGASGSSARAAVRKVLIWQFVHSSRERPPTPGYQHYHAIGRHHRTIPP